MGDEESAVMADDEEPETAIFVTRQIGGRVTINGHGGGKTRGFLTAANDTLFLEVDLSDLEIKAGDDYTMTLTVHVQQPKNEAIWYVWLPD